MVTPSGHQQEKEIRMENCSKRGSWRGAVTYLRGRAVSTPVEEGDGVAVVILHHGADGPGPDLDAFVLRNNNK